MRPRHTLATRTTVPAVVLLVALTILTGCGGGPSSVPDMEPVGSGLRFIGVGLVVMALVFVLRGKG